MNGEMAVHAVCGDMRSYNLKLSLGPALCIDRWGIGHILLLYMVTPLHVDKATFVIAVVTIMTSATILTIMTFMTMVDI